VRLSYTNPLKLVKTKHGAVLGKREDKLGGFRFNAFEHGPQVLAIDGRLTFAALGEVTIDPSRPVQLTAFPSILPAGWVGTQAYKSDNLRAEERVILVPFSDTGQLDVSHAYRTWIRATKNG